MATQGYNVAGASQIDHIEPHGIDGHHRHLLEDVQDNLNHVCAFIRAYQSFTSKCDGNHRITRVSSHGESIVVEFGTIETNTILPDELKRAQHPYTVGSVNFDNRTVTFTLLPAYWQ